MNIALVAQNRKKELMVQFCIAYCGVLAKHNLCATGTTGKMIMDAMETYIEETAAAINADSFVITPDAPRFGFREMDGGSMTEDHRVAFGYWHCFIPSFPNGKFSESRILTAIMIRSHVVLNGRTVNQFVLDTIDFNIKVER